LLSFQTENGTSMAEVRAYEDNYFKIGDFASISKRMGTRYLQRYLNRFLRIIYLMIMINSESQFS